MAVVPNFWGKYLDEDVDKNQKRWATVDGLRGWLALAVVIHHCVINFEFQNTGVWQLPNSNYYTMLGQAGVSIFFMITAFLFWGKIIDAKDSINWWDIYIGRIFRIVPLYWVTIFLMLVILAAKTGFKLNVPINELLEQLFKWILPGTVYNKPAINGYQHTNFLTAGVTWTLYYEWLFYLSLPALSALSIKKSPFGFLPLSIFLIMVVSNDLYKYLIAMFTVGMLVAAMVRQFPLAIGDGWLKSCLALVLLSLTLIRRETSYEWTSVIALGTFFALVASGASIFGLLKTKAAHRLGAISYGIYLLQGPVIAVIFSNYFLRQFSHQRAENFWISSMFTAIALIVVASISYLCVEKPSMKMGKMIRKKHSAQSFQA